MKTDIVYRVMEKREAFVYLPRLFALLDENMRAVAPSGNAYEEDCAAFCEEVGTALLKENRRIVLITDQGELIGFLQYYTNDTTFMIEEAQLKRAYQGRRIMKRLFVDIAAQIPQNIPYVEAFTHKNNEIPQGILRRNGFVCIDENCNGRFCHFRGDCGAFFAALTQKRSAADCFSEQSIKV